MKKLILLLLIALPMIGYAKYYPAKLIYTNGSEQNVLVDFPLPGFDDEIKIKKNNKSKKSKIQLKNIAQIELSLNNGADKSIFICRKINRLNEKEIPEKYDDYRALSLMMEVHEDIFFSRAGNSFEIRKNKGLEKIVMTYQVWFSSYIGKLQGENVTTFDIGNVSDRSIELLVKDYFNNCQKILSFLIANKKMKTTDLKKVFSIYKKCDKD